MKIYLVILVILLFLLVIFRKTILNMCSFECADWKHVFWLFGVLLKNMWNRKFSDAKETWYWIAFHCKYPSTRIK